AAARNVISGNRGFGVLANLDRTTVQGNYIGTDATGSAALLNTSDGVRVSVSGTNSVIGPGNVLAGNGASGIQVGSTSATVLNAQVRGNFVGTSAAGTDAIPNAIGLNIVGSYNNVIGGPSPGDGNVISGNTG